LNLDTEAVQGASRMADTRGEGADAGVTAAAHATERSSAESVSPPAVGAAAGGDGVGVGARPQGRGGTAIARTWAAIAWIATLAGVGCVYTLLWAIEARMTRWEMRPFALLIYGAAASAVVASVAAHWGARLGAPSLEYVENIRRLLWIAVVVLLLWVWFPPADAIVGWWERQVSVFRFGA
jgi:hypothetical protein